jgi:hypothetical protein
MTGASESRVQALVRLEAPEKGVRLWRNNVGVLVDLEGRPVRFGLANDTKALNEKLKSGDLIGWRKTLITPDMVGTYVAVFTSRECKPEDWMPAPPTNVVRFAREEAQRQWARLVNDDGGDARFATGRGTL